MTRRSPWAAFGLAVLVAAGVVLVERVAPEPTAGPGPAEIPAVTEPVGGSWVCAVGDGRVGTSLTATIARAGAVGSGPATVELVALRDGSTTSTSLPPLFPPSHAMEALQPGGDDAAVWGRWSGRSATVSREWRWEGNEDLPAATVAGPCAQPNSPQWIVPGMSSAGGNEARLRLANPFRTDATVAVHFVTPEGVRAPIALQNWTVPARTVREINVNEVVPEIDDLAAVVDVATGRLSVEGYQIARVAIGGIDGASLLSAAPAPAETWTVPWLSDDTADASWLWIVNTGERTAPVELTLHTAEGGDVPAGLAELTVPPGELRRVDLTGTLPEGVVDAAVTVRSDGAPVVVSGATRRADPDLVDDQAPDEPADPDPDADPEQPDDEGEEPAEAEEPVPGLEPEADPSTTGFAIQLGVPELDASWVVSGGATAGRAERLQVVNPSGEDATVDVVLFDGSTVIDPEELRGVAVPPGSAVSLDVSAHLGDVAAWSAFVSATDGAVVVGRVGWGGEGALHLVAAPGTPASAAAPAGELLAGTETAGLVHRMGTSLGLRGADPFDVPSNPPAFEPGGHDLGLDPADDDVGDGVDEP